MTPTLAPVQYCAVFRRRAWIIVLVAVLGAGGALYDLAIRPPQYQAEASILVTPQAFAPAAARDTGLSPFWLAFRVGVLNDIAHLLRSRTISERAAEQLGDLSGADLARRVMVRTIPGTDFLIIRAADPRPERAALIANALAQELNGFFAQLSQTGATRARLFLDEELRLAQDRVGAAEQAVVEFQIRTGAQVLPDEVSRTAQRILDLQAAQDAAALEATVAETRVTAIRSHLAAQKDGRLASLSIATNPVIAQIRDHLTGLELELADLRQVYTDQHPAVKVVLGKIAAERERLSAETAKVLDDTSLGISPAREQFVRELLDGEVGTAVARARAAKIRAMLGTLQARLSALPTSALTLARLQREARDAEQWATRLAVLRQEAVLRESQAVASGQSALVVVDPALAPSSPIAAPFPQAGALAGVLGLCLGAALALAVEVAETRLRAWRRPEAASGVPEPAPGPAMIAEPSYRSLAPVLRMAVVLLPVVLVGMVLGVMLIAGVGAAGVSSAQVGPMLAHLTDVSQALAQAVYTHISQALTHGFSPVQ